jgi:putative restriction endonuclease
LARHSIFTEGSPSVQVDVRTLQQALQDGLSFERKANNEIAIGFRSDQFIYYCQHAVDLHHFGTDVAILPLLERAAERQDIPDQELIALPQERERIVRETARLARAANFRLQVLQAYDSRCAVTRWQMKIVDAAHILPVAAPESVDDVRNGIALSATYHRAFDSGLIYLDEDLVMRLNRRRAVQLGRDRLGDGLDSLAVSLGRIHLPPDPHQWPDVRMIRFANRYRNISA